MTRHTVKKGVNSDSEIATVRIMVTDTGSGLNSDSIEQFYSLRTTSHTKGDGIGLFVINKLTRIMGGKFEVHSPIREKDEYGDRGSEFHFSLEFKKATDQIIEETPPHSDVLI